LEELARIVAASLARNGCDAPVDHRRLAWSPWFRCEHGLNLLLIPSAPGIFALGEEILATGPADSSRRMLAVFQITETEDLGMALARLFAPAHPLRDRLASGRCFARVTPVADPEQRNVAGAALRQWLATSAEQASGVVQMPATDATTAA
jgi:hypothetical protein